MGLGTYLSVLQYQSKCGCVREHVAASEDQVGECVNKVGAGKWVCISKNTTTGGTSSWRKAWPAAGEALGSGGLQGQDTCICLCVSLWPRLGLGTGGPGSPSQLGVMVCTANRGSLKPRGLLHLAREESRMNEAVSRCEHCVCLSVIGVASVVCLWCLLMSAESRFLALLMVGSGPWAAAAWSLSYQIQHIS